MLKRLLYLWLLLVVVLSSAQAEVVVLRSGMRIKGEIVLNNEEIVIVRKKDGSRYQYPKTEIVEIQSEQATGVKQATTQLTNTPKVATRIALAGGSAYVPHHGWGGMVDAQIMVGTHQVMSHPIFLGGSIGYRGVFGSSSTYSWLPMQLVLQSPIAVHTDGPHRLMVGASLGYAIALGKQWGSGLCTGIDIGWWYRISDRSSISIACTAQWQQTHLDIIETIENNNLTKTTQYVDYINHIGCNIVGLGIKIGIQF